MLLLEWEGGDCAVELPPETCRLLIYSDQMKHKISHIFSPKKAKYFKRKVTAHGCGFPLKLRNCQDNLNEIKIITYKVVTTWSRIKFKSRTSLHLPLPQWTANFKIMGSPLVPPYQISDICKFVVFCWKRGWKDNHHGTQSCTSPQKHLLLSNRAQVRAWIIAWSVDL